MAQIWECLLSIITCRYISLNFNLMANEMAQTLHRWRHWVIFLFTLYNVLLSENNKEIYGWAFTRSSKYLIIDSIYGSLIDSTQQEGPQWLKGKWKLFTFPTCDFIWFSSFVGWDVRNPNPKISRSYELYRRRYSTSRFREWAYGISATPFRGWFTGLCNKPPPVVEAKAWCESANNLKLK